MNRQLPDRWLDGRLLEITGPPQVIEAVHDVVAYARSQAEIEQNGVVDNAIFFAQDDLAPTGANFQGTPFRCRLLQRF